MTKHLNNDTYSVWSPVVVRAALGIVFVAAGIGKLLGMGPRSTGGIGGFAGFLAQLGVPAPELAAWGIGFVELLGGLLILVGLFTSDGDTEVIAHDLAVATLLVHVLNGFAVSNGGYEYTLVLALIAVALVLSGPGALSLEYALYGRERLPMTPADRDEKRSDRTT